jgi:hypothetical protein
MKDIQVVLEEIVLNKIGRVDYRLKLVPIGLWWGNE